MSHSRYTTVCGTACRSEGCHRHAAEDHHVVTRRLFVTRLTSGSGIRYNMSSFRCSMLIILQLLLYNAANVQVAAVGNAQDSGDVPARRSGSLHVVNTIETNNIFSCSGCTIRANGTLHVKGTIKCTTALCAIQIEAINVHIYASGSIQGGDVTINATTINVQGTVSTNGQGYAEVSGDGKGGKSSSHVSTSSFRVSGSGGGHGGNGAAACYRYTSYGNLPAGNHAML